MAAQLREAGLDEVELQAFERHGVRGTNVIATLRAPGDEFVVIGAHHDTAPEAPGAYDDGGGVGILIELGRVLARDERRPRTIVLASFDGEEAWSTGKGTTAGSRAFVERLGPARPVDGRRVRDRDVGLEGRDARPAPDRLRGPARERPRGDRPGVARARGARGLARGGRPRSGSATPTCRGSTSRR